MSKYTLLLCSFFLLVIIGCKKANPKENLRIDIGTTFYQDDVRIKLCNDEIFLGSVSTNEALGVAEIINLERPIGNYKITVNVNGIEKTEKFRHKEDRFIYISFDRDSGSIAIDYPDEPYIYE